MRVLYTCFVFLLFVLPLKGQLLLDDRNSTFSSDDPVFYDRLFMCSMSADTTGTLPAVCHGTATGSVFLSVTNATQPISLYLNGTGAPYSGTGISNSLAAGTYFLVVVDGNSCRDTVYFSITQPTPVTVSATSTDAKCYQQPSGTATAVANGGMQPYGYQWESCNGSVVIVGAHATGLLAGCYKVTVTDKQGCSVSTQVSLSEPPQILYTTTVDSVSCFQGIDGSATISASGGKGGFSYLWDNGQTTTTATGLNARFHYVTITDITNCSVVAEVNIPGPERVIIDSISRVLPNCFGGQNGTATAWARGGTPPYSYLWSAGTASGNKTTGLSSGLYRVTVIDSHGCRDSLAFLMNTPPPMSVAAQNIVHETCLGVCNGSARINVTGGVSGYSYSWGVPGIPTTANQTTSLCAGQYTVTITDAANCSQTVQFTINPGANLQVQFSGSNPTCSYSSNGSISATVFGGQSPFTYLWSSGQNTPAISGLSCGQYQLIATDSRNCKDTATYLLNCPPALVLDSMVVTSVRCFGNTNGSLAAWFSGGTTPYSFDWSLPGIQNNSKITNLGAGSYTVTITDVNGCSATSTGTVTTPLAISATTQAQPVLCFGQATGTANVTPTGGTGSYTYLWNNGATLSQINQLAAGSYTVTVTDQNGCTHVPAAVQVTQPLAPLQLTNQVNQQPCAGSAGGTVSVVATGGTAGYGYAWSNGLNGATGTQLAPGQYGITVTDANGCTSESTFTLQSHNPIEVQANTQQISCFGQQDAQITIHTVTGGAGAGQLSDYQYLWSNGQTTPALTALSEGSYSVTITDAQGCTVTQTFNLFGTAPIIPHVQSSWLLCHGDANGVLKLDSITSVKPITDIRWSNGSIDPQQIIDLQAGVYSVIVTDINGCTGQASASVFQPDVLSVSLKGTPPRCQGDENGSLSASVAGGVQPYKYAWSTAQNSATIDQLGIGHYKVTITDANGCILVDSFFLDQPDPVIIETKSTNIRCHGANDGIIRAKATGGTRPYNFSIWPDSTVTSGHFYGLVPGVYTVVVSDQKGCTDSDEILLLEPEKLQIELGDKRTILYGEGTLLEPVYQNAVGQPEFSWRSSEITNSINCTTTDCSSIWAEPLFTSVYYVLMRDSMGCTAEDRVRIEVEKPRGIYVPTGFTPNGDSENDILNVFAKTRMIERIAVFRIYDRHGAPVFELFNFQPNDQSIGWDGTIQGKPCEQSVYSWYLEAIYKDGYQEKLTGNTTLIR